MKEKLSGVAPGAQQAYERSLLRRSLGVVPYYNLLERKEKKYEGLAQNLTFITDCLYPFPDISAHGT